MPEKIVFTTHCSDDRREDFGVDKLIASAKHFHPEIPMVCFGSNDILKVWLKNFGVSQIVWYNQTSLR
jgi:hypothetical protein